MKEGLRSRKTPTIKPSVLQKSTKTRACACVCVCVYFINVWVTHVRLIHTGCGRVLHTSYWLLDGVTLIKSDPS